jgi:hypothetical protein
VNIVERTELAGRMWALLIPTVPAPSEPQLARWAARFTDVDLEKTFAKIGRKLSRGHFADRTELEVWKYTTTCLLGREAEQKRNHTMSDPYQEALKFFHERYLEDSSNDPDARQRFADCVRSLGSAGTPDQIASAFERHFTRELSPEFRTWFEAMITKFGDSMTFGDMRRELQEQNPNETRSCER